MLLCVSSSFVQFDVLKAVRSCAGCAMFRGVQGAGCWMLLINLHIHIAPLSRTLAA